MLVLIGGLSLFCAVVVAASSLRIDGVWRRKHMPISLAVLATLLVMSGSIFYAKALSKHDDRITTCQKLAVNVLATNDPDKNKLGLYNLACKQASLPNY